MADIKVLIVGASGLVGGNCMKALEQEGISCTGTYYKFERPGLFYYDTLNPGNPDNLDIESLQPDYIIHAGALTHVDYCETHPEESYEQTVKSTQNLLEFAGRCGAGFIYISTDYVFDGVSGPYDEAAQTKPLSIYGKHKLEAEQLIINNLNNYLILRVTNVYGDEVRNKNFVSRLIEMGKTQKESELHLPADQYATPINALDIGRCIYALIGAHKTGVYHLASTDYLNRVQLSEKVLSNFPGHKVKIQAIMTSELNQPAPRPLQGGLKAKKFLSEFPYFGFTGIDGYLTGK